MTRRDFELIARVVRGMSVCVDYSSPETGDLIREVADDARDSIAHAFADELAQTNARFDRARFLKACGVS